MSRAQRLIFRLLISSATLLGAGSSARGASIFDPSLRFRTLATEHFIVYFHQGEERLAWRLAEIAEDTRRRILMPLGATAPTLTHVVLVDQTELANGLATPVPYNTVVVTAAWPAGVDFIGRADDWLRLVFTHEFTHIAHLERSEGWAKTVRGIFGRVPIAFPNLFLPRWHIEGIATYEESALGGGGRLHAGDFRAVVDEAARTSRLEPLDRVNGGLTDWPGGLGAYAYGAGFHAFLAQRFGEDSFAALADATAGRVPFLASRAFEQVYGRSLGALWREYETAAKGPSSIPEDADEARGRIRPARAAGVRRLTHHGFDVSGPRFDHPPCDDCPAGVIYSVRTPHEFPALYRLARDGTSPRRLATRYLGSTSAVGRDVIYFDQQERRRNVGVYSDLYALERRTGRVHRMTSEARLIDPDLAPDGRMLACVHYAPGRRDLVLIDVTQGASPAITVLISEPDTQFNTPRWSPDGRTIAVERHVFGRLSEIALVDVATRAVRTIASAANARFVTPAWRPDGRALVAAADLNEGPFELYEFAVNTATAFEAVEPKPGPLRRLTYTTGGATWPDVSADGRTIVFVGYASTGFDLFEMPYPAIENADLRVPTSALRASQSPPGSRDVKPLNAAGYNPIHTLKPTSWSPIVQGDRTQLRVGLTTGGGDVLGYHAYSVSATWLATGPMAATPPDRAKPDWQIDYQYGRWRPALWLSASSSTLFFAGPADERGSRPAATAHERLVEGGVVFPVQHARISHTALFSVARVLDDFTLPDGTVSRQRTALRAGWAFDSSHTYGYSISREGGAAVGVTTEIDPQALGSSADATAVTIDGRAYLAGFAPHHVLAIRMAGGMSTGDPTVRRTFHLGGAQPNLGTLDFGRNAISLLRGFGSDTFAGSHVAVLNVDYRVPLARPQRGYGTWPLFLHTVSAAGFADVGHAWNRQANARDLKTSVGGELSLDVIAAYVFRFTTTFGAAWGRDGSRTVPNGGAAYVRLGRAF